MTTKRSTKKPAPKMPTTDMSEVRAVFDQAVADATSPDERAMRELLREYFTNQDFKKKFTQFAWDYANGRGTR